MIARLKRLSISPEAYAKVAAVALVALILIVFTGSAVPPSAARPAWWAWR